MKRLQERRTGWRRIPVTPLLLVWVLPLAAQEIARPFSLPDLGADQQAATVRVAIGGDHAVLEERGVDGTRIAAYSRTFGAFWEQDEVLWTGGADALAIREDTATAAVAVGQQVRIYSEFFAGDWVYNGSTQSVLLPADTAAKAIEMAGSRIAVVTRPTGFVISGGNVVRIYVQSGGGWSEEAAVEIERIDPVFGTVPAPVAAISFDGNRLAILVSDGSEIGIFGRDVGGVSNWGLEKSILPAPGTVFGESVALAGERLLVRAASTNDNGIDLHQRNTGGSAQWGRAGRLLTLPADIETADIDASGGCLMVTGLPRIESLLAPLQSAEAQAWMFEPGGGLGGWALETVLPLGDPGLLVGFGTGRPTSSVSSLADLSGDDAVVGFGLRGVGRAAVWAVTFLHDEFEFGWAIDGVWGPGTAGDFSSALAFGDGYLAVGNPRDDHAGSSSGSVLLWQMLVTGEDDGQVALPRGRIESPDAAAGQLFGSDVATAFLTEGTIIIGGGGGSGEQVTAVAAVGDNGARGAVYVFDGSAPGDVVRVDPEEILAGADYFGLSIALVQSGASGDAYLAVGAPGDDDVGLNAGAVYVFRRNQGGDSAWGLTKKITRPAAVGGSSFGAQIDAGSFFTPYLVAAREESPGNPGRAALFGLPGTDTSPVAVFEAPVTDPVEFATSVAISSGVVAVGARGSGGADGRVYLYSVLDLAGDPVIVSAPAGVGGNFGDRLSLHYPFLGVGAPDAADGAGNMSTFLIAEPWTPAPALAPQLLFSRNGSVGEGLGGDVASWFVYTAAGAPGSDTFGTAAGRVRLERAGTYEIWAKLQGLLTDELFNPHGDPDGDGQSSLTEFTLGSLPFAAGSLGTFELQPGTYVGGGGADPAMVWQIPPTFYAREWLDFRIKTSTDLIDWVLGEFRGGPDPGQDRFYLTPPGATHGFYQLAPRYPWPNNQSGSNSGF